MERMVTIGTDSEIFARNKFGKAIALCGKIGGTKQEPKQLDGFGTGFCVQEDNVSVEFNIAPASSEEQWEIYIAKTLEAVGKILNTMDLHISPDAAISFDKDQLIHPDALIFGCEPDYNAWSKMENAKPHCADESLRTAGGHIHVGTRANMITCVENMDLLLGVPSVLIDDSPASLARKQLYGKAGAMRPKSYGFEYRVLSNFWIFTPRLRNWVYNNTAIACEYNHGITSKYSSMIQECINTGNKKLAEQLIKACMIPMPDDVKKEAQLRPTPIQAPQGWYSIIDDLQAIADTNAIEL